jgi:hypothetical protein
MCSKTAIEYVKIKTPNNVSLNAIFIKPKPEYGKRLSCLIQSAQYKKNYISSMLCTWNNTDIFVPGFSDDPIANEITLLVGNISASL